MTKLYLVIPCYNEEEVLPQTARILAEKMETLQRTGKITQDSRVLLVDDGSKDATWDDICALHEKNAVFTGLKLSRNRGHQNALLAGLMTAKDRADAVVSMDADLQDDPNAIDAFLAQYENGFEMVLGVRSSRKTDSIFKRFTAQSYYKMLERLGVNIVYNHADYRLMSARALNMLAQFGEVNLFLRGMVPQIGLKTTTVPYERHARLAGESKYPLKKMLALAWEGVTSFSTRPLRFLFAMSGVSLLVSLGVLVAGLILLGTGKAPDSTIWLSVGMWLVGSIQLFGMGILGEYIGKIYAEVKHRPRYLIETDLDTPGDLPQKTV